MATAGLSFANPFLVQDQAGPEANPYTPTANIGLGGLRTSAADLALAGQQLVAQARPQVNQFTMPKMVGPSIAYNAGENKLYVQGQTFDANDAATALSTENLLAQPGTGLPGGPGWTPLSPDTYQQFLDTIKHPTKGELLSKGWDAGVQQLKQLYGGAAMVAGAEQYGAGVVDRAQTELDKLAPYDRTFTDTVSDPDASLMDWFVYNLGTQGPMLLSSLASGIAGSLAGTAAAGPGLGTAGGFIAGVFGRKVFQEKIVDAAAKYAAGQLAKDSAEYTLLKNASKVAGATAASFANSYVMGAGDIYNEMREQGVSDEDFSRLKALAGAFPYAATDLLPEMLVAARVLGIGGRAALKEGASLGRRAGEAGIRFAQGSALVGGAEGTGEAIQEGLTMGLAGEDLTSPEALDRFINSFAAGAAVGGVMGGVSNLRSETPEGRPSAQSREEVNLLGYNPPPKRLGGPPAPGTDLQGPRGPGSPEGFGGGGAAPNIRPNFVIGSDGVARISNLGDTVLPAGALPPGGFGPQGVLDLGPMTIREAQGRQNEVGAPLPNQVWNPVTAQYESVAAPGTTMDRTALQAPAEPLVAGGPTQLALQAAPPAPSGTRFTDAQPILNTQMAEGLQSVQRQGEHQNALAQIMAQRAALRERQMTAMEAERQQQIAEQGRVAEQAQSIPQPPPMQPVVPRQPEQLPLFTRREAPIPSRGQALRRGVAGARLQGIAPEQPQGGRAHRQMPLFTKQGEPAVAALKSAGKRRSLAPDEGPGGRNLTKPRITPVTAQQKAAAEPEARRIAIRQEAARKLQQAKMDAERKAGAEAEAKKAAAKAQAEEAVRKRAQPTPKVEPEPIIKAKASKVELKRGRKQAVEPAQAIAPAPETAEQAWDVFRPEGAPAFGRLPAHDRVAWRADFAEGKASPTRAAEILDLADADTGKVDTRPLASQIEDAIDDYQLAPHENASKAQALRMVADQAYFGGMDTNSKAATTLAREHLASVVAFSKAENAVLDAAVREGVASHQRLRAKNTDGTPTMWFERVISRGLLKGLRTVLVGLDAVEAHALLDNGKITLANLPTSMQKELAKNIPQPEPKASEQANTKGGPAQILAAEIMEINRRTSPTPANQRAARIAKLKQLWDAVQEAGLEDYALGDETQLSDYFNEDGEPNINLIKNQMRVGTTELTVEQIVAREAADRAGAAKARAELAAEIKQGKELLARGTRGKKMREAAPTTKAEEDEAASLEHDNFREDLDDFDFDLPGRYFTSENKAIVKPVSMGRVRLIVHSFLSRLARKPNLYLYKDQADLKTRNPKLYAQATAGRTQGDFDTARAVGYSFGIGQVLIFTDRVATEQQLRFVLAHETLGHFGFRGLMSEAALNAALDKVYNDSARVRGVVDIAMQTREMNRHEATEEYLADFAGTLDTNVLARFWAAIKNALNKIGVRFEDDMARYLVSQSRRYVRNGESGGHMVQMGDIGKRMMDFEAMRDPLGTGRFALAAEYYDEVNHLAAESFLGRRSTGLGDTSEMLRKAQAAGTNIKDFSERVLAELKTMNFLSRENQGYRRLYEILRDTVNVSMELRTKYNNMMRTVLRPAIEPFGVKLSHGATKAELEAANKMLDVTSRMKHGALDDAELRKLGSLIDTTGGDPKLNQQVYDALRKRGTVSLEEFRKGFTYKELRERPKTADDQAAIERERDAELAKAKDDEERSNIRAAYADELADPSKTVEVEVKFPAMPDLTEDSLTWKMYNEVRTTMDESAIDMLMANFNTAKWEFTRVQSIVESTIGKKLSETDAEYLSHIIDKFLSYRGEGLSIDDRGAVQVTKEATEKADKFIRQWHEAFLAKSADKYKALLSEFYDTAEYDDAVRSLESLKEGAKIPRGKNNVDRFAVQQAIQNLALTEFSKHDSELLAKRSITGGYVPFGREGIWQVRVQVEDAKTGQVLKASDPYRQQMIFSQTATRGEAERIAAHANEIFANSEHPDGIYDIEVYVDGEPTIKQVRMVAMPETARDTMSSTSTVNLNDVVNTLTRFGIAITPKERQRLVVGLTRQNSRARNRLMRMNTPGRDPNVMKFVSKHLESVASTVARKQNRPHLDKLFTDGDPDSERLWRGSQVEYDKRKALWEKVSKDPNMSEQSRMAAKRAFDDYHYTYVTKNAPVMANRYKDRGRRLVSYLESQSDVEFTDFGSGATASQLRMWTTFAQLGGSFATGALNVISLTTNVLPALTGYNSKNGFGGGFGFARASAALTHALAQIKNPAQSDVQFWNDLLADPAKLKASGFTEIEARFMQKEVASGSMQAALQNALLGSARGRVTSGAGQAAARAWMGMFSYTEQAARRATGLATFRLEFERALQEAKDAGMKGDEITIFAADKAHRLASAMIDDTLGEYATFNRPAFFRGDLRQFLFIYKMFPVNSVLLLSSMAKKEQLLMLGILMGLSGVKGLPFADDLMDLIDTIAQQLGLGPSKVWRGSAERTLAEALHAVAPGMTPLLMRGLVNSITPANMSDRTSLSNLIPGTGIGLANADMGRELMEIAGPLGSFMQDIAVTAGKSARYLAETAGISPDTTTLTSLMRTSPSTMIRAIGDMSAYMDAGAIVNRKGYIVSPDITAATYLTRALGFYPAEAVRQNDVVRMAIRTADYAREVSGLYRGMYVAAKLAHDNDRAREAVDLVREWNKATRGTGMEIHNFVGSATRALHEARKTTSQRFTSSASKGMRPQIEQIQALFGAS